MTEESVLVVMDSKIGLLGNEKTEIEYKDMTIVDVDGYEGRFLITKVFTMEGETKVFNASRIPEDSDEEQFLIKYKEQMEKAYPVAKIKGGNTVILSDLEKIENKTIGNRLELITNLLESGQWSKEDAIDEIRSIADELRVDFDYMKTTSELFKHKEINTTQQYIEGKELIENKEFEEKADFLLEMFCENIISEEEFRKRVKKLKESTKE